MRAAVHYNKAFKILSICIKYLERLLAIRCCSTIGGNGKIAFLPSAVPKRGILHHMNIDLHIVKMSVTLNNITRTVAK